VTNIAPPYGLTFQNIPTINLRLEFDATLAFVDSDEASSLLTGPHRKVRAPMFDWVGMPNDLFTVLLQRAILGVEAYLPSALSYTLAVLGNTDKTLIEKLRTPSAFGAKSMAANIYHRMPAAVHPELSLQHLDQELYEETVAFYREIRNPIFHGKEIASTSIESIRQSFKLIGRIYTWVDYWHDPEKTQQSEIVFGSFTVKLPKFINRAP
jgi:hypothetical protein